MRLQIKEFPRQSNNTDGASHGNPGLATTDSVL